MHRMKQWDVANKDRCQTHDRSTSWGTENLANWATTCWLDDWNDHMMQIPIKTLQRVSLTLDYALILSLDDPVLHQIILLERFLIDHAKCPISD